MRDFAQCTVVVCLTLAGAAVAAQPAGPQAQTPGKDATPIVAAARQALGGEKKLSAVKSFSATGRTRQVRGENLVPIEFEIFVELPDKYLKKDEIPAQETGVTAAGFNGDALVQDPPPLTPPPGASAPPAAMAGMTAARVNGLKQDFARLMLGMFAQSTSAYPLTFTYYGEAEAPDGKADVIDAKGPNNFSLRLFVDRQTHLPVMVTWQAPAPPGRGRPGGPGAMPPGAMPVPLPPGGNRGAAPPTAQKPTAPESHL
jgi:hypothetical protein